MFISEKEALTFDDVLLVPDYSEVDSRSLVDLSTTVGKEKLRLPIIASNMDTITGFKMASAMDNIGAMGIYHRADVDFSTGFANLWELWTAKGRRGKLAVSVGSIKIEREKNRLESIFRLLPQDQIVICAEIAHGDSKHMIDTIKYIRDKGFEGTLISGAVCTPDGVMRLCEAGADAVRVGIGPGSACSTRIQTGCGYPQFSAIYECAKTGKDIIADGGISKPGDAAKALAAGAKAIMIGGMLKGTDCVPGWDREMIYAQKCWEDGDVHEPTIVYRGMASNAAKIASGIPAGYEEGISTEVKCLAEGSTEAVIKSLTDGIVSAASYQGAFNLPDLVRKARFVKVTAACSRENRPHALT